jgi:hypothetical protein
MLKKLVVIALSSGLAVSPLSVMAQTGQPAAPAASSAKPMASTGHKGSHRSYHRQRHRMHKQRQRGTAAAAKS